MWTLLSKTFETKERIAELWTFESDLGTFFKSLTTYIDPNSSYVKMAETSMEFVPELNLTSTSWIWTQTSYSQTPGTVHGVDLKVDISYQIALSNGHFLVRTVTEYRDAATQGIKSADESMKASQPNDGGVTMQQLNTILAQYRQYSGKIHSLVDNGKYANLQAAVDASSPGDVITVGPCPAGMSTWGNAVLTGGISIMGIGAANNPLCRIGQISFAPTAGVILDNTITLSNVEIDSTSNIPCVLIGGNAPMSFLVTGCNIRRDNGTAPLIQAINTNAGANAILNGCMITNYGTSTGLGLSAGMGFFKVINSEIEKCSLQCNGGLLQVSHCQIEYLNLSATTSLIANGGIFTLADSLVTNNGVGGNGVSVAAGAVIEVVNTIWNIPDLTGYVAMGAGAIVVNSWVFNDFPGNTRNTKVQNTLNVLTMNNTPTIVA